MSLDDVKEKVAKEAGFTDWYYLQKYYQTEYFGFESVIDNVSHEYAKQFNSHLISLLNEVSEELDVETSTEHDKKISNKIKEFLNNHNLL